ncbi:VG15 protein [Nocardia sp. NPDC055049]
MECLNCWRACLVALVPSSSETRALQQILQDLRAAATGDLTALWRLMVGKGPIEAAELMVEAFVQIIGQFMSSAAQVSAVWYDDLSPESEYRARPSTAISEEQLRRSARWAMSPMFTRAPQPSDAFERAFAAAEEFERGVAESRARQVQEAADAVDAAVAERAARAAEASEQETFEPAFAPGDEGTGSPLERLIGAGERHINNASRQTITENADEEGVRWARHAEPDACAFCRMLATRGAIYLSEADASRVTGGADQRVRGNQKLGEAYHDRCNCMAVPDRPGSPYVPPDYVDGWIDEYEQAASSTNGTTEAILREMRRNDVARNANDTTEDDVETPIEPAVEDSAPNADVEIDNQAPVPVDPFDGLAFPNIYYFPSQDNSLLSDEERRALWSYASGGHRRTNEVMRGNADAAENIEEHIGLIDSAMQRYTLPQTYRVTRSVEASDIGLSSSADAESLLQEYLHDRAFLSTSGFRNPPFIAQRSDPVVLDIIVPEGSHAILMNEGLSPVFEQERELLLPGRSRLQVIGVRYDDSDGVKAWRLAAIVRAASEDEDGDNGRAT